MNLNRKELLQKSVITAHVEDGYELTTLQHDSRKLKPGDAFLCLKGENFDGHDFIPTAVSSGASMIIAEEGAREKLSQMAVSFLIVSNTTLYAAQLANFIRHKYNPFVVAITGTNGKTSTKDILSNLLKSIFGEKHVVSTIGNLNNHWGLPFTLFNVKQNTKIAVVEIGTNHPGEISKLTQIAEPNMALITSISGGHIGNFVDMEAIAREKSDIMIALRNPGYLILASQISNLEIIDKKWRKNFPHHPQNLLSADRVFEEIKVVAEEIQFTELNYHSIPFKFSLKGRHQIANLALAIMALETILTESEEPGLDSQNLPELEKKALSSLVDLKSAKGRLQIISEKPFVVWDDSYNANPASFAEALLTFDKYFEREKSLNSHQNPEVAKWIVAGQMAELGQASYQAHLELAHLISNRKFNGLLFIGDDKNCRQGIEHGINFRTDYPLPANTFYCSTDNNDIEAIAPHVLAKIQQGDWVLIKGSRSAQTERLLKWLCPVQNQ